LAVLLGFIQNRPRETYHKNTGDEIAGETADVAGEELSAHTPCADGLSIRFRSARTRSNALRASMASRTPAAVCIVCQERAGVAQRFSSRQSIEFGEIYNSACAGESVGNDRFAPLAEFEGNDEWWRAQFHSRGES
jgi:hypothetical protein